MARFTRTISLSYNLLAAIERLEQKRQLRRCLETAPWKTEPVEVHQLGRSDRGRNLFARKKRGLEVGKTKKGKGTKVMLMVDGQGVPLAVDIISANHAEVKRIEPLIEKRVLRQKPKRLMYDRAADSDPLRERLGLQKIELVCHHRKNRKKPARQDGRTARRLSRRYRVERTISWLYNKRRLVVRYEYHPELFLGFIQLACLLTIIHWF